MRLGVLKTGRVVAPQVSRCRRGVRCIEAVGSGDASRQQRSAERFPCHSVGFSASGTTSPKDHEPPRKASNLSPKPSPNVTVLVGAICRN